MSRKLFTLDDLYNFFVQQNQDFAFDSSDTDSVIVIQVPATFSSDVEASQGLLPVHMRVAHTGLNRNSSFISEENMQKYINTLQNKPILGNIIVNEEGVADFHSHDMIANDDGTITYVERPIGVFPESCNAHLEYDGKMDKTYVVADGYIYEDYGNQAADILRESGSKRMSCELVVEKLSYNAKEKYLEITDFYFNGATVLGSDPETGEQIKEGMQGSQISLENFSVNKADIENYETISEMEETSDPEETEDISEQEKPADEQSSAEESVTVEENKKPIFSIGFNGKNYNFEISLDEIIYALTTLVNDTYSEADNAFYSVKVYDKNVVMVDCWTGKAYRQSYKNRNGVYSLTGDRIEVYPRYLSRDEEAALDELRSKYEAVSVELKNFTDAKAKEQKEEIMASEDYEIIKNTDAFKELFEDVFAEGNEDKYTADSVRERCDSLLLKYVKSNKTFAAEKPKKASHINVGIRQEEEYKPYGNLFADMK